MGGAGSAKLSYQFGCSCFSFSISCFLWIVRKFYDSANGGGTVSVALVNDSIPLDVQRLGDELVIRMTGATVPNNLLKQLNVGRGLVRDIVTNNQGRNGVIRIVMNSDFEYKAYQTGNQLNISIDPPRRLRQPTLEERTYSGAPLSLEFQDVSVRTILEVYLLSGFNRNTEFAII